MTDTPSEYLKISDCTLSSAASSFINSHAYPVCAVFLFIASRIVSSSDILEPEGPDGIGMHSHSNAEYFLMLNGYGLYARYCEKYIGSNATLPKSKSLPVTL